MKTRKTAVVLMNLGGPDSQEAVKPFLYNLFCDPAIINLPFGFRHLFAWGMSSLRTEKAKKIYEQLGGGSPIVHHTVLQKNALEKVLNNQNDGCFYKVFVAMRYWNPLTEEAIQDVEKFQPDRVVLLPLYPQFSTTTTASSLKEWFNQAKKRNFSVYTDSVCCYPLSDLFVKAYRDLIAAVLKDILPSEKKRLLFSAHGLPQKVIDSGDPYEWQVNQTVHAIMDQETTQYRICYQSKVGPLKWLGPSLDDEMVQAAKDNVGVIVVPVSFVSEHSETLVELDKMFFDRAKELNLPFYKRVQTVGVHDLFIQALVEKIKEKNKRVCPKSFQKCWCSQ